MNTSYIPKNTDSVYWRGDGGNKGVIRGHIGKYNIFVPDKQQERVNQAFYRSCFFFLRLAFCFCLIFNNKHGGGKMEISSFRVICTAFFFLSLFKCRFNASCLAKDLSQNEQGKGFSPR